MSEDKDPAAVTLGRRGGQAGTGKSKVRGDSEWYKEISAKGVRAKKKAALKRKKARRTADRADGVTP